MDRESWIEEMIAKLRPQLPKAGPAILSLDQIGEAAGVRAISADDVEALFARLEADGIAIGDGESVDLAKMLREVIQTALQLRAKGEKASPENIAKHSSLSKEAVKIALLYSEVLRG